MCFFSPHLKVFMLTLMKVRYLLNDSSLASTVPHMPPFIVYGRSCSVFLETLKRGDLDDAKGIRTVVLRLYEAYGGHASVCLQVNMPQRVIAAYGVNLLEDDVGADSLALERTMGEWGERPGEQMLRLVFRGFEVKTIKVVLAKDA
jgi:alpha-mannosidase